jgi:hypothetical protein
MALSCSGEAGGKGALACAAHPHNMESLSDIEDDNEEVKCSFS